MFSAVQCYSTAILCTALKSVHHLCRRFCIVRHCFNGSRNKCWQLLRDTPPESGCEGCDWLCISGAQHKHSVMRENERQYSDGVTVTTGSGCCAKQRALPPSVEFYALLAIAGGKAGKDSGKAKAKAVSRSARAGLQFPVGRIHRHLKNRTTSHGRVGATAFKTNIFNYLQIDFCLPKV
ncbi:unnamed protein product, partial [Medioppia subpectinata]